VCDARVGMACFMRGIQQQKAKRVPGLVHYGRDYLGIQSPWSHHHTKRVLGLALRFAVDFYARSVVRVHVSNKIQFLFRHQSSRHHLLKECKGPSTCCLWMSECVNACACTCVCCARTCVCCVYAGLRAHHHNSQHNNNKHTA